MRENIFPLLDSKIEIPRLSGNTIIRSRLIERLNLEMEKRVILLVAPTGYGKTTLLIEWLANIPPDRRVAWITLDKFDNTDIRFWSYVASSLKKSYRQFQFNTQEIIQHTYAPQDSPWLDSLINEIAKIPYQLILVLDDYHTITNSSIHQDVQYLIEHQPANLHLVISSRTPPPIPIARLRVQRQLCEINAADLSFTLFEVTAFINRATNLVIAPEQINDLWRITEGWPAGLVLSTLSYPNISELNSFKMTSSGNNQAVFEYLMEEVLNSQPQELKDFLLKTSILGEFSAPLCDYVLERTASQVLINRLQKDNLFLAQSGDSPLWYRYHPLFAEALEQQLKRTYPNAVIDLHRKAYEWLLSNHLLDKAVLHAIAAGELDKAASIVNQCALEALYRFDLWNLIRWLNNFPKEIYFRYPQLGIYGALANYFLGRINSAISNLDMVEQSLIEIQKGEKYRPAQEKKLVQWELEACRAVIECYSGDCFQGIRQILAALETRPSEDRFFFGFLNHTLAMGYSEIGDYEKAKNAYINAHQFALRHQMLISYVHTLCNLGRMLKKIGYLSEAEHIYQKAVDFAIRSNLNAAIIALGTSGLAEIALERNELEKAYQLINNVIRSFDQIVESPLAWLVADIISFRLAKYYHTIQDYEQAESYLEKALARTKDMEILSTPRDSLLKLQVQILLASGKPDSQQLQLETIENNLRERKPRKDFETLTLARIYLTRHQLSQAEDLLTEIEKKAYRNDEGEVLIEALILLALTYFEQQKQAEAFNSLEKALQLAQSNGYIRIFLDEGEKMRELLDLYLEYCSLPERTNRDTGMLRKYVRTLLHQFDTGRHTFINSPPTPPSLVRTNRDLPKTLTKQEAEVLQLVLQEKTNKEIATALSISINTVKVHIKHIYKKLGVHSRRNIVMQYQEPYFFTDPTASPLHQSDL